MGHRYQKGSRRPKPGEAPKGKARQSPYVCTGTIPWPELGDGTPWREGLVKVTHPEVPGEVGRLQAVEWHDGEWTALVAWGPALVRHPLHNLLPSGRDS